MMRSPSGPNILRQFCVRLTITQLASRLASEHSEFMPLTYPVLYRVVRPMLESGQLSCHSEPWRARTRRFVFRTGT